MYPTITKFETKELIRLREKHGKNMGKTLPNHPLQKIIVFFIMKFSKKYPHMGFLPPCPFWPKSHFRHVDLDFTCPNPNLGFTTKAMACKGVGQKWSSGVTFHAPGSVRECERMNPHTPKWAPILGVVVSINSWIFKGKFQGSKPIILKNSLYHWKALET